MGFDAYVIGVFAAIFAACAALAVRNATAARNEDPVGEVAKELGLQRRDVRVNDQERIVAAGNVEGVEVQIREGLGDTVVANVAARISAQPGSSPRGGGTGDPAFDVLVSVQGERTEVLSALHARARSELVTLLEQGGGNVENGVATRIAEHTRASLADAVRRCVRAAKALDERAAGPATLLQNLREDRVAAYRAACFHELLASHASTPQLADAARFLAETNDPLVPAARILARGADGLRDASPDAIAESIFRIPRRSREPILRRVASMGAAAEPVLFALLARTEGPMVENAPDGAHDAPALVTILEAIGAAGSTLAVERLKPHASGLFTDGNVKEAARAAIAAIQSRAKGEGGALSIAEPEGKGGAVSLSGEDGRVSIAPSRAEEKKS